MSSAPAVATPLPPRLRLYTGRSAGGGPAASRGPQPPRPAADWTLTQLYERFLLPCLFLPQGRPADTIEQDRLALARWRDYSGDPPLAEIDAWTWPRFVEALKGRQWRGQPISPNTVHKTCVTLKFLLGHAGGWRGPGKAPGLGLVELPYAATPPAVRDVPQEDFAIEEIERLIAAAEAEPPKTRLLGGLPPRVFWPNLFRFAYNTALRPKSVLGATRDLLDKNRPDWLWLPAHLLKKTRQGLDFYVNARAREAVEAVGSRERLFPWGNWPKSKTWFYTLLGRIETAAGIPEERQFDMKGFRAATLTWLSGENDLVAKIVAGHRSGPVLLTNYANRFRIVPPFLDRLPQPGTLCQRSLF